MSRRAGAVGQNTEALPFGNSLGRKRGRRRRCFVRFRPCAQLKRSLSAACNGSASGWKDRLQRSASLGKPPLAGSASVPSRRSERSASRRGSGIAGWRSPQGEALRLGRGNGFHWASVRPLGTEALPFFPFAQIEALPFLSSERSASVGKTTKRGRRPRRFFPIEALPPAVIGNRAKAHSLEPKRFGLWDSENCRTVAGSASALEPGGERFPAKKRAREGLSEAPRPPRADALR